MKGDPHGRSGGCGTHELVLINTRMFPEHLSGDRPVHQFTQCHGSRSHFSFVFVLDGDAAQGLTHAGKSSATEMLSQTSKVYLAF